MAKRKTAHTIVIGETHLENAQGALVPIENVKPIDRERDALVREIIAQAEHLSRLNTEFRSSVLRRIDQFVTRSARSQRAGIGGVKGNLTLPSYDGSQKVIRAIDEKTIYDERIAVAFELIKECVKEWGEEAPPPLRVITADDFRTDKEGNLNHNRINQYKRYNFDHPKWRKAMKVLNEAEQIQETRTYVRFYKRDSDGQYQPISISVTKG